MSPQPKGICDRFYEILLKECDQVPFHKTLYTSIEKLPH
jgi:hypothetical protein